MISVDSPPLIIARNWASSCYLKHSLQALQVPVKTGKQTLNWKFQAVHSLHHACANPSRSATHACFMKEAALKLSLSNAFWTCGTVTVFTQTTFDQCLNSYEGSQHSASRRVSVGWPSK